MSRTALTNLYGTAVSSFYPNYLLTNSPEELEKYSTMNKTSKATARLCLWDTEFNYNSQEQWCFFRFPRELPLGEFHFPLYICLKDLKLFWWTILWGSNIRRFKEIPSNWKQIYVTMNYSTVASLINRFEESKATLFSQNKRENERNRNCFSWQGFVLVLNKLTKARIENFPIN